jgi:hypothetical protein
MKTTWRTAWQAQDIVVYRDDTEIDRLHAPQIERVLLMFRGSGESPGDLVRTLVELGDDWLLFAADTGFAGRVNFERQDFWAQRACVYWLPEAAAALPLKLRRGAWPRPFTAPVFCRVPRADLAPLVAHWPLQGPQTWEQRKWRRIARGRPFAPDPADRMQA